GANGAASTRRRRRGRGGRGRRLAGTEGRGRSPGQVPRPGLRAGAARVQARTSVQRPELSLSFQGLRAGPPQRGPDGPRRPELVLDVVCALVVGPGREGPPHASLPAVARDEPRPG